MKFFVTIFLLIAVCGFSFSTTAQDFDVPENVTLKTKDDFAKTEKDIINASKWLEATKLGKEMDKRAKVNAFVLMWITNSPTITVEINMLCTDLSDKNPHLLGVFLASYCRYVLENNYSKDNLKGYTAGIKGMVNCYNLGGDRKKNKLLEKAVVADKDGKLEEWVKENMK